MMAGLDLADLASWVLLSLGGFFVFVGGLGALRLPDLYTRLHATSLTDTLGTIAIISGLMLQAGLTLTALKVGAVGLFLLFTCPAAAYALSNAAFVSGHPPVTEVPDDPGSGPREGEPS